VAGPTSGLGSLPWRTAAPLGRGYVLGGMLTLVGLLASTTDICIASLIYRSIFGFPPKSAGGKA